jgi:hypothetical protein
MGSEFYAGSLVLSCILNEMPHAKMGLMPDAASVAPDQHVEVWSGASLSAIKSHNNVLVSLTHTLTPGQTARMVRLLVNTGPDCANGQAVLELYWLHTA